MATVGATTDDNTAASTQKAKHNNKNKLLLLIINLCKRQRGREPVDPYYETSIRPNLNLSNMLSSAGSTASKLLRKRIFVTGSTCCQRGALFHASSRMDLHVEPAPGVERKKHELSQESKEKVEKIFQKILWLDMIEVHLVTELINQKMGLHLTDKQRAQFQKVVDQHDGGAKSSASQAEEVKEEAAAKTVDLKLTGFDEKSKIKVIKEVRSIAGLGLKEAKELVEGAPSVVQRDLSPESAEELKKKLEEVGAQIELA